MGALYDREMGHGGTKGYVNPLLFFVLIFITFGLWIPIWIVKTTAYLNRTQFKRQRSPFGSMLLCFIIPFYFWYWVGVHGDKIDQLAESVGKSQPKMVGGYVVISILSPIFGMIFLQSGLNKVVLYERKHKECAVNEVNFSNDSGFTSRTTSRTTYGAGQSSYQGSYQNSYQSSTSNSYQSSPQSTPSGNGSKTAD